MTQYQIENLSAEEYSYFVAYGTTLGNDADYVQGDTLLVTTDGESNCFDGTGVPSDIENVCCIKGFDPVTALLQCA